MERCSGEIEDPLEVPGVPEISEPMHGSGVVVIEDASKRPDVVFASVIPGRWKQHTAGKPRVFVVLIDFSDFHYVMGDERALNAFDVGWDFFTSSITSSTIHKMRRP